MSTIAQPDPTTDLAPDDHTALTSAVRSWPRRAVLTGSGAALLACAACGSGSTVSAPASASDAAASVTKTTAAGSPAALATVADVPETGGLIVSDPSGKVVLAKADGKVVAHTAVCTHQGGIIDGAGVCPLHGSKFDVVTGAVLNGPATVPLAAISVTESGGKVFAA